MKLKYTYDEEPTHYSQEEVEIPVTRLRATDRFKHRSHGWVTVTLVDVRVKKVKITYVADGTDVEKDTFSDIDIPDVKVVRQTETPEHELWRVEHEATELLDRLRKTVAHDKKEMTDKIVARLREGRSPLAVLEYDVDTWARHDVEAAFVRRLDALLEVGPSRPRIYDRDRWDGLEVGDLPDTVVRLLEEDRHDMVFDRNGRSMGSLAHHAIEEARRRAEHDVLGRSYGSVGRLEEAARRAMELRVELG